MAFGARLLFALIIEMSEERRRAVFWKNSFPSFHWDISFCLHASLMTFCMKLERAQVFNPSNFRFVFHAPITRLTNLLFSFFQKTFQHHMEMNVNVQLFNIINNMKNRNKCICCRTEKSVPLPLNDLEIININKN